MPRRDDLFGGVLPFVHAAEARSFRRAAERLGVTPAAVSKAVLALEERLGTKLLARTSRTVALTPEGAAFLARARDAVASLQAARETVADARRQPRGEVALTVSAVVARPVLRALPRLAERHPQLAFRVSVTDRLVRLAEEGVDVAVRVGALDDSGLVARPLRATRWATVASPAYLARHRTPATPADLAGHDCLRFLAPNGRPREFTFAERGEARPRAVRVSGRLVVDQGEHLLEAALGGLGICQVLDFMVADHLAAGRLVELLAAQAGAGPPIQAVSTPERARSANVRALFAFLVETFARLGPADGLARGDGGGSSARPAAP
jgi:DNA-binding transcriptional LysR family regulator